MNQSVLLSADNKYRFRLGRAWGPAPYACFIMLNPSIADASVDDPTIRSCIRLAKAWGRGGFEVVNLFALRTTNPQELYHADDPIGPDNDAHILAAVMWRSPVVVAWGMRGVFMNRDRAVLDLLRGIPLLCLGRTKTGAPRHPLYTRTCIELEEYA